MNKNKKPLLCLKLGVPAILYKGERIALKNSPKREGDSVLLPGEAAALIGIDSRDDYADLDLAKGLFRIYDGMDLIFLDDEECEPLDTERDLEHILSLAHSFIFEIKVGHITGYEKATDDQRADFIRVGEEIREILLKRNNTHPFLFGKEEIFTRLRAIYLSDSETEEKKHICHLIKAADRYLENFPALNESGDGLACEMKPSGYGESEYDIGGRHSESEGRMQELLYLAFAYQMTHDERYAKIAYYCALSIIGRKHWGPGHFLNCSGATSRLATLYDWLYNIWSELKLDTGLIRRGIYTQGLHHGYNSAVLDSCDFPSPKQGTGWRFKAKPDNWNSVCNSGLIIGALCVLNDGADEYISKEEYEKTTELLGACLTSTMQPHLVFTQYAPDGSYVESNSYWVYGTTNLVNTMSALYDSLGTDLGLHFGCGINKTCYYAVNSESADFVGWNYHDGSLSGQDTALFNQLATISGDGMLYAIRKNQISLGKNPTLFDMMYHPCVRDREIPKLSGLTLDYVMVGIDAFTVRSGFEKGSLFAAMIGGKNPEGGSHNQLDSGAFVYHNLGKMWITDLGPDYYNSRGIENGKGYFENYALYRRNAEGNNCLCLTSLPYGQLLGKRGYLTEYRSSDAVSYCVIDNTEVYGKDRVVNAKRGMLLTNNRKTLIIKDEVTFTDKESAFSTAHFESDKITASICEGGKRATLTHTDGTKMHITLLGDGAIEVMGCDNYLLSGGAPAEGELSREKLARLVVRYNNVTSINTSLVFDADESSVFDKIADIEMWKTL